MKTTYVAHVMVSRWPECWSCGEPGSYDLKPVRADGREAGPLDRAIFVCCCGVTYEGLVPEPPECFA